MTERLRLQGGSSMVVLEVKELRKRVWLAGRPKTKRLMIGEFCFPHSGVGEGGNYELRMKIISQYQRTIVFGIEILSINRTKKNPDNPQILVIPRFKQ